MDHASETSTADAECRSLNLWLWVVLTVALAWRAYGEIAMMRQHGQHDIPLPENRGSDASMSIWYIFFAIKMAFWFVVGWLALYLTTWPSSNRGRTPGFILLALWLGFIGYGGWQYQLSARALADAANPATAPERLTELASFNGLRAGSELENRIAANPNSPGDALLQAYRREPDTTAEILKRNPNTPAKLRERLGESQVLDV